MIIFRIDAFDQKGWGYINSDIYLASMLKKYAPVVFCTDHNLNSFRTFMKKNISFCSFDDLFKLEKDSLKSVIFNVRHFKQNDMELLQWAKDNQLTTVQMTGLGLNQQSVDYTIDASIANMVPYHKNKKVLIGPDYFILHHKFRHFNRVKKFTKRKIKKIFLNLGEDFNYRQLRKLIEILCCHNFRIKIYLGNSHKKSSRKILKRIYPSILCVGNVKSLARPLFESDIALVTAGDAAYEAAACGTPSLYFYLTKEQEFIANSFEELGIGCKVQGFEKGFNSKIIEQIKSLNYKKRNYMGCQGKKTVDAKGVYRIVDFFKKKDII